MKRPRVWQGKGRTQRRKDAEARKAEAAKRSPAQQLARLDKAGWKARRERARLAAAK